MKQLVTALLGGVLLLTACAGVGSDSLLGADRPAEEQEAPGSADQGTIEADEGEEEGNLGRPDKADQKDQADEADQSDQGAPAGSAGEPTPAACTQATGGGDSVAQLVDVRVGTHDGYDRVVFEFAPPADGRYFGVPRFELAALDEPIVEDGSGLPVKVAGSVHAGIVFHGASGAEFTSSAPQGYVITYAGPRELRTEFPVLAEAQQTGDFEATLSWAFGLNQGSCWEVSVIQNPLRVVIDFPHE